MINSAFRNYDITKTSVSALMRYLLVYGTLREGMGANRYLEGMTRVLPDRQVCLPVGSLHLYDAGGFPFLYHNAGKRRSPYELDRLVFNAIGNDDRPAQQKDSVYDLIDDNVVGPVVEVWKFPQDREAACAILARLDRYEGVPTLYNRDLINMEYLYVDGRPMGDVLYDPDDDDDILIREDLDEMIQNSANVYTWADEPDGYELIPSQDWARRQA